VGTIRVAIARGEQERSRERERVEMRARFDRLSRREGEVMQHVIAGRLNKQIAAELGISVKTVKAHRAKVMQKMQARSVPELLAVCRAAGVPGSQLP
jgi:FixJ family two-component response regulator